MDRYEADWPMVERGWKAHVLGEAPNKFTDPIEALKKLRRAATVISTLSPLSLLTRLARLWALLRTTIFVVIANFRADRVVEISKAFEYADFKEFDRVRFPTVKFAGLMQHDGRPQASRQQPGSPSSLDSAPLVRCLLPNGLKTFACSETQKFGHVTFFWNGSRSGYFNEELETYVEIPSDNVPFNQAPLM